MSLFPTVHDDREPTVGKTSLGNSESAMDRMAGFMSDMRERGSSAVDNALTVGSAVPTEAYFPPEMIGGCCPQIEGQEAQMAWQAAAEALDSERLHFVWRAHQGYVWFLAVKSSDLASHSHSWCPLAALLPGMENAQEAPVLYLHDSEGLSTLMTVAPGELSIHRGASMVIQAKAERVARDHNHAPIYNLLPEQIDQLTPVAWQSMSLLEDKARRFIAVSSTMVGLAVAVLAFVIWLLASFASMAMRHDLSEAQAQSATRVEELMKKAADLRSSPLHRQMGRFAELNDQLLQVGGWLKEYRITNNRVQWKAVLPPGVTADAIAKLGGRTSEVTDGGITVVGN